jgi:hypothetical protein
VNPLDIIGTTEITVVAGDKWRLTVSPISFPDDRDTGDFASFTATIREDPGYPRRPFADDSLVDPAGESWTTIATASGTASSATAVYFDFDEDDLEGLSGGFRRYVIDAVGLGGTAGPAVILKANWLTVYPRVTAFS